MSLASIMPIPASCSLVSANGPSVTITLPSFHRKDLVSRASSSACPPSSQCPFLCSSSAYTKHSSTTALRLFSSRASQASSDPYPRQTNFIILSFVVPPLCAGLSLLHFVDQPAAQ